MLTVCGGNRTRHGADTQQVLASVVRTARHAIVICRPDLTMLRATGRRRPRRRAPDLQPPAPESARPRWVRTGNQRRCFNRTTGGDCARANAGETITRHFASPLGICSLQFQRCVEECNRNRLRNPEDSKLIAASGLSVTETARRDRVR